MIISKKLLSSVGSNLRQDTMLAPQRSLNLLLADWANRGLNQWTIKQRSLTLTQGTASYDLAADVIDVLSAVCREPGQIR